MKRHQTAQSGPLARPSPPPMVLPPGEATQCLATSRHFIVPRLEASGRPGITLSGRTNHTATNGKACALRLPPHPNRRIVCPPSAEATGSLVVPGLKTMERVDTAWWWFDSSSRLRQPVWTCPSIPHSMQAATWEGANERIRNRKFTLNDPGGGSPSLTARGPAVICFCEKRIANLHSRAVCKHCAGLWRCCPVFGAGQSGREERRFRTAATG